MLTLREAKPNEGMAKLASGEKKRFGHRRHFSSSGFVSHFSSFGGKHHHWLNFGNADTKTSPA
jgi:hypothetical protein